MADKTKLKFLGKEGYDFKFVEIDTGAEVLLKIYKDKNFKDTLKEGDFGWALVNTNWVNEWQPIESEDDCGKSKYEVSPPKKEEPKVTDVYPAEKKPLPFDIRQEIILSQSTLKEAVQLYNRIYGDGPEIDYEKVFEIHRRIFTYMSEGGYKYLQC